MGLVTAAVVEDVDIEDSEGLLPIRVGMPVAPSVEAPQLQWLQLQCLK